MLRIFCALLCVLLSSCDKSSNKKKEAEKQKVEALEEMPNESMDDVLAVPVVEEVKKPKEVKKQDKGDEIPKLNFTPAQEVITKERAKLTRGERRKLYMEAMASGEHRVDVNVSSGKKVLSDNYKDDKGFSHTESTLPKDQSRMLLRGMLLGATIQEGIHSQYGSRIVAKLDRPVFSVDYKKKLLDSGTILILDYKNVDKLDVSRVPITVSEIRRPDGVGILLAKEANCQDCIGYVGVAGNVDNRTFEKYGAAAVITGLSAAAQTSSTMLSKKNETYGTAATNLSNVWGQVTANLLENKFDLNPIITTPQAYKIYVRIDENIYFKKMGEV